MRFKVRVVSPFILRMPDGTEHPFPLGAHEVDEEKATHPYMAVNIEGEPEPVPEPSTKKKADK